MKSYTLVTLIVFLVFFFISNQINFSQNDDWVYILNTKQFLAGDFKLHPYLGPSFFMQGIMGMIFAELVSIEKLPLLTLIISVLNLFLFLTILDRKFNLGFLKTLLLGLLFMFNPLNIYLTLGYMTELYFVFFMLISFIFFEKYEETQKRNYLYLMIVVSFLGLLVRQVALVIPLSFFLYSIYKKDKVNLTFGLVWFGFFYFYLERIFPKTPNMIELPLQFQHILNFDYTYSLIYGVMIMTTAFLLPLFINFILRAFANKRVKNAVITLLFGLGFFLILNKYFKPSVISWGEFPYFENTFERTGFYPRGIHGTKYHFAGIFDLYRYWDFISKVILSLFIYPFLKMFKSIVNFYSILFVAYIGVLVLTETFFDRYMLVLIPIAIIVLVTLKSDFSKISLVILLGFLLFLIYFSYLFSMDFILVNKYIWNKSLWLVEQNKVENKYIYGTNSWKLTYPNSKRDYKYFFSYDSPVVNEDLATYYDLLETKEIKFPINIFVKPRIYLYQMK